MDETDKYNNVINFSIYESFQHDAQLQFIYWTLKLDMLKNKYANNEEIDSIIHSLEESQLDLIHDIQFNNDHHKNWENIKEAIEERWSYLNVAMERFFLEYCEYNDIDYF
jgi:hypothetical protein